MKLVNLILMNHLTLTKVLHQTKDLMEVHLQHEMADEEAHPLVYHQDLLEPHHLSLIHI